MSGGVAVETGNGRGANRIHVLYLVDKSGFGGIQTIAATLMNRSFPDDVRLSYFFLRNLNSRFGMKDASRDNVRYSAALHRYSLRPFFELCRIVRRDRIDILHLNGNKSIIFGVMAKILANRRLKIIAHEHGGVFDWTGWYALVLRGLKCYIDLFISLSRYRREFLVSRCGVSPDRIRVLYNFVDPGRIKVDGIPDKRAKREAFGIGRDDFVIGYLGGLSRIKGCDILIEAAAQLKGQGHDFRLVITGDGPARLELERLAAEREMEERIVFLGYQEDPVSAFALYDILVMPSRSEAGPVCLYEAWLCGLPVIASDAPVLNEVIKDSTDGLLFRSGDAGDLACKILLLRNDPALRGRLKSEGALTAASNTIDGYLPHLTEIYRELATTAVEKGSP